MKYPINLIKDGDGYTITFPDIPEAITEVHNEADIYPWALECFESALEFYSEDKRPIPLPSNQGDSYLSIPVTTSAKIHLFNAWIEASMSKKELSQKTGIKQPNIQRLFDFKYKVKIEAIEKALNVLGKNLEVKLG